MNLPAQIAKHLREVYFGGNWTMSSLKENLADVTWQQATRQVYALNTIATLVYHINYYVSAVLKVLEGSSLNARDADSFNHPSIESEEDWQQLLNQGRIDAECFAKLIERLSEARLAAYFIEEKYGIYYRNLQGIIEHAHYHLGQIVIIKKILSQKEN